MDPLFPPTFQFFGISRVRTNELVNSYRLGVFLDRRTSSIKFVSKLSFIRDKAVIKAVRPLFPASWVQKYRPTEISTFKHGHLSVF
jgi:hypothetical protein